MNYGLQKASIGKRIAAWMLDMILVAVLAVGVAFVLSACLGYDAHQQTLNDAYTRYEAQYNVDFQITQEQYQALTPEQKKVFDEAFAALAADEQAVRAYNMMLSLALLITSAACLLTVAVWELVLPLILKNGQTLGKKVFGLCLVRSDGVKINTLQLFTRAILGKYTIELMIPLFILIMMFWGVMGVIGPGILLALGIAQLCCLAMTRNHAAIHDLLAGTAVVDMSSQKIFQSTEELIAYQKALAADRAARQTY